MNDNILGYALVACICTVSVFNILYYDITVYRAYGMLCLYDIATCLGCIIIQLGVHL